jgi:hypothetical protein
MAVIVNEPSLFFVCLFSVTPASPGTPTGRRYRRRQSSFWTRNHLSKGATFSFKEECGEHPRLLSCPPHSGINRSAASGDVHQRAERNFGEAVERVSGNPDAFVTIGFAHETVVRPRV